MNGITVIRKTDGGADAQDEKGVVYIPTGRIVPERDPDISFADGTLTALAESIHRNGMLTPLEVCPSDRDGIYLLIAGEKRLRAAKMLGLSRVPCVICENGDNIRREKHGGPAAQTYIPGASPDSFDQAESLRDLCEIYCCTQEELARKLSVSQSYIANKLRLLRYTKEERELIRRTGLSERHARAAVAISDMQKRRSALEKIASEHMSVSEAEEYIASLRSREEGVSKKEKVVLHDLRAFCNSIDNAVKILIKAGLTVSEERTVGQDGMVVKVTVKTPPRKSIDDASLRSLTTESKNNTIHPESG